MSGPGLVRPTLQTDRLRIRPFTLDDVPAMVEGCSPRAIAATALAIPHPYAESDGVAWVESHAGRAERGESLELAITDHERGMLLGGCSIRIDAAHRCGEIGYVVYLPHQGRGIATEAARALTAYGFDVLDLNRIEAHCFEENAASARVLEKCGMRFEGLLRQKIIKWGEPKDLRFYGVLRSDRSA